MARTLAIAWCGLLVFASACQFDNRPLDTAPVQSAPSRFTDHTAPAMSDPGSVVTTDRDGPDITPGMDGAANTPLPTSPPQPPQVTPGTPASSPAASPRDDCAAGAPDPKAIILLGDAYWMANARGVQDELERHARAAGALNQAERFRGYYESNASMDDIVAQYDAARREDPNIRVVIMNGGGSDILFDEQICFVAPPPDGDQCVRAIERLVRLQSEFLGRLSRDGVRHVVFYFYPHMRNDTLAGPLLNRTVDYAAPRVREACERAQGLDCHFVDPRPAFEEDARDLLALDGILPTEAGSELLGEMLWDAMPSCDAPRP